MSLNLSLACLTDLRTALPIRSSETTTGAFSCQTAYRVATGAAAVSVTVLPAGYVTVVALLSVDQPRKV